jgi:hypothetical protein
LPLWCAQGIGETRAVGEFAMSAEVSPRHGEPLDTGRLWSLCRRPRFVSARFSGTATSKSDSEFGHADVFTVWRASNREFPYTVKPERSQWPNIDAAIG